MFTLYYHANNDDHARIETHQCKDDNEISTLHIGDVVIFMTEAQLYEAFMTIGDYLQSKKEPLIATFEEEEVQKEEVKNAD